MAMNFGDISIDFDKKQVCKNGNPIVLTALEYRLFAMLAKNSGKVLTVNRFLNAYGICRGIMLRTTR